MRAVMIDSSLLIHAFRRGLFDELNAFLDGAAEIGICEIVRMEIQSGIVGLKSESTREEQLAWFGGLLQRVPCREMDRVLCDSAIFLAGMARRHGFQAKLDDAIVGAAAKEIGAMVATHNIEHFKQLGVEAFNPLKNPPGQPGAGDAVQGNEAPQG